jgi:hypothetical protein
MSKNRIKQFISLFESSGESLERPPKGIQPTAMDRETSGQHLFATSSRIAPEQRWRLK